MILIVLRFLACRKAAPKMGEGARGMLSACSRSRRGGDFAAARLTEAVLALVVIWA